MSKAVTLGVVESYDIKYTNSTGSTIASDAVVDIGGGRLGVAGDQILNNTQGVVHIGGEFHLAKETGIAFALGDPLAWDAGNSRLTHFAPGTGNKYIGICSKAALSADTKAYVTLTVEPKVPPVKYTTTGADNPANTCAFPHGFKVAPGSFNIQIATAAGVRRAPQGIVSADATNINVADTGLAADEIVHVTF